MLTFSRPRYLTIQGSLTHSLQDIHEVNDAEKLIVEKVTPEGDRLLLGFRGHRAGGLVERGGNSFFVFQGTTASEKATLLASLPKGLPSPSRDCVVLASWRAHRVHYENEEDKNGTLNEEDPEVTFLLIMQEESTVAWIVERADVILWGSLYRVQEATELIRLVGVLARKGVPLSTLEETLQRPSVEEVVRALAELLERLDG